MAGFIKSVSKALDKAHKRKLENRTSYGNYLAKKGQYKLAKAEAANKVTQPRLDYKLRKRGMYTAAATAGDTQQTARLAEQEATKREEIRANRDLAIAKWSNLNNGNPSVNGQEGNTQGQSTTTMKQSGSYKPSSIITEQGYKVNG